MKIAVFAFFYLIGVGFAHAVTIDESSNRTEFVWEQKQKHRREVFVLHFEEKGWVLDCFVIQPGHLQQRTCKRLFAERDSAVGFLATLVSFDALKELAGKQSLRTEDVTTEVNKPLWVPQNQWSWEWELKYAKWLQEEASSPSFLKDHGVATDCADVAYSYRWIFARINRLPMASRISGSGVVFSHESMRSEWLELPTSEIWYQDKRFLAALDYVLDMTYTHTLIRDSYPLAINPSTFHAGIFFLSIFSETGHTQLVREVNATDNLKLPIRMMASTVPRQARVLSEYGFWQPAQPKENGGGFLSICWPQKTNSGWTLVPAERMPGYSKEQYLPGFMGEIKNFALAVMKKINANFDPKVRVLDGIQLVKDSIESRIGVVEEGYRICRVQDCREGTNNFENWSTPSRDARLASLFADLDQFTIDVKNICNDCPEIWKKALAGQTFQIENKLYPLKSISFVYQTALFSSDPTQSIKRRWGFDAAVMKDYVSSTMKKLLVQRTSIINANSCNGCTPGSTIFERASTYQVDDDLQRLMITANQYCAYLPSYECSELQKLMAEARLDHDGSNRSISDWLKMVVWYNSDPRTTRNERWGAVANEVPHLYLTGATYFVAATNGIALIKEEGEPSYLYDLQRGKRLFEGDNVDYQSMKADSGWVLGLDGANIVVLDTTSGTKWLLPQAQGQIKKMRWLNGSTINVDLVEGGSEIIGLDRDHWRSFGRYSMVQPQQLRGVFVVADSEGNHMSYSIVDGRGKFSKVDVVLPTGVLFLQLLFETEKYFFAKGMTADNVISLLINKQTGEISFHSGVTGFIFVDQLRLKAIIRETNGYSYVSIDSNFQVKEREAHLGAECVPIWSPHDFLCFDGTFNPTYYRYNEGTLQQFHPPAPEKIMNVFEDFVLTKHENVCRLRQFANGQELFRAYFAFFYLAFGEHNNRNLLVFHGDNKLHANFVYIDGKRSLPLLTGQALLTGMFAGTPIGGHRTMNGFFDFAWNDSFQVQSGTLFSLGGNSYLWMGPEYQH